MTDAAGIIFIGCGLGLCFLAGYFAGWNAGFRK